MISKGDFMDINKLLSDSVERFKSLYCKDIKCSDNSKKLMEDSINLAYRDVQRTLKNISDYDNEKSNVLGDITESFESFFKQEPRKEASEFGLWHKEICEKWTQGFDDNQIGTFGKAQKLVNMTFKYLYCFYGDSYNNHFKYCHMPLDSYTLEWFKRYVGIRTNKDEKLVKGKVCAWSNLQYEKDDNDYYTYIFYKENIDEYIRDKKLNLSPRQLLSPLQLEFIIWPEIQLELATENYIIIQDSEKKKKDIAKLTIKNKIEGLRNLMSQYENDLFLLDSLNEMPD